MFNLIQIQDAIKGLPVQDVMKYARGSNPEVPAYLALSELNRRKQIQDTATSFYGEPQTVREQIENSLTNEPQGQVNPTAAPQMANLTAPPQLQTLTAPPARQQMPPQVNPTQAPPVPQMRKGGLASLPIGMFKRSNYAGGGIVAFSNGTGDMTAEEAAKKQKEDERRRQMEEDRDSIATIVHSIGAAGADTFTLPTRAAQGIANQVIRGARAVTGVDIPFFSQNNPEYLESLTPFYDKYVRKAEAEKNQSEKAEAEKRQNQMVAQDKEDGAQRSVVNQNKQVSNTTSGQVREPAKPMFAPKAETSNMTDEQFFARIRKLQELAGVSQDPYSDIKKRYSELEAKRATQEAEDPKRALLTMLGGFAQANPTDPFGVQLGAGSDKMDAFNKETAALRDKQASAMNELQLNMAKEEDARKRGDVTSVISARAAQDKNNLDLAKLEIDRSNAQANMVSATRPAAEVQMIERVMKDKNMSFVEAAEFLQGLKGMNALRTAADKEYNESLSLRMEWEKKGGYPAYMASKGLSVAGSAPNTSGLPPTVVKDGKTYILNPQTGKYREQ